MTGRSATLRTCHGDAATAAVVAAALRPDNTASMATRVEGADVVTTVERETTGGLASSVDDYVVNATVAARVAAAARDDGDGNDDGDGGHVEQADERDGADADADPTASENAVDGADAGGATPRGRRARGADGHETHDTHDT